MKAKVIMPFKDKETNKTHNTGAVIEVTPERYAEIRKAGNYVVEEEPEKPKKAVKTEKKA